MRRFDLSDEVRRMVEARDFKGLMESGGNIYFVMKLGAATGYGLYTMGAMFRGETLEEFLETRSAKGAR
jgi:protocatechuate 4,5-dioxygenase, alpha chain